MAVLLLVVFLTIFISAQCSLYEATLYSTRMGSLESVKSKDRKRGLARKMMQMKRRTPKNGVMIPEMTMMIPRTLMKAGAREAEAARRRAAPKTSRIAATRYKPRCDCRRETNVSSFGGDTSPTAPITRSRKPNNQERKVMD